MKRSLFFSVVWYVIVFVVVDPDVDDLVHFE